MNYRSFTVEDKGTIEALDMTGKSIETETAVRYIPTGTVGRAIDIKEDEEGIWVMIDITGLYYRPETLVVVDSSELKEERKARSSVEDAESYVSSYGTSTDVDVDIGQVTGGG